MNNRNFNIIEVNWHKPNFIISDVYTDTFDISQIPDKSNVIYQIYGNSPIYGNDALLYIGQTVSSLRRIQEHLDFSFNRIVNLSIRIGEINFGDNKVEDILDITESILITMLKPSYNALNIKDVSYKAKNEHYLILNKGNKGIIPQEISNIWWF